MGNLRKSFEALGLSDVKTYIQSGNVLFKSNQDERYLGEQIEQRIETDYGFSAAVVLRTAEELEGIIKNCPFSEEEIKEAKAASGVESLYAALLPQAPTSADIEILNKYQNENDRFIVSERDIYLLFRHSVRDSKLAGKVNKLSGAATVRNFKTIRKLIELAKDMKG
jgi:uncharacterized protein (DUF1697 family)